MKYVSAIFAVALAATSLPCLSADMNTGMPGVAPRYATDLFPGFDMDATFVAERKTPRWFSWWNGPKKGSAAEQLEWADSCRAAGDFGKARKAYDALVREWPVSPEAPLAQKRLADVCFEDECDYIDAFEEYKYLLDYYSAQCDYSAIADRLFETAEAMRAHGKKFLFVPFSNAVDVRKAYESAVLRAPGAAFAPKAMLVSARLWADVNEYGNAVSVCETLRNSYSRSPEAREALLLEADMRMKLLEFHGYNNSRARDTVLFLKAAVANPPDSVAKEHLSACLAKAEDIAEEEAWKAARFYDSPTRPAKGAADAYRNFASEYPAGRHADEARARIAELDRGNPGK